MDYEKMYNEALKRVRRLHDRMLVLSSTDALVASAELEFIFPELAESESEDERIRMALIKLMTVAGESYVMNATGFEKKQLLAYLEKQKEPIPIPDKFSGLKSLMLQYFDSAIHRNDDAEIESDTDLWGRKILGYVWKYSDEQKEQKPDWSEEDEDMLNSCISSIEEAKENRYAYKETDGGTSYDHEIDWLKSLRPQYHGDVTMTEAYKMGLEAGKASSWKPSEEQQSGSSALKAEGTNE